MASSYTRKKTLDHGSFDALGPAFLSLNPWERNHGHGTLRFRALGWLKPMFGSCVQTVVVSWTRQTRRTRVYL